MGYSYSHIDQAVDAMDDKEAVEMAICVLEDDDYDPDPYTEMCRNITNRFRQGGFILTKNERNALNILLKKNSKLWY